MNSKLYNWDSFHEKRFEELCVHIARYKFKDANFNTYLKQGNKQFGIDIISGIQEDGKYICIQCKREKKKYTERDINKILEEFKKWDSFSNSSKFILATTVDLQNQKIRKHLEETEQRFYKEYNIRIEWWDITQVETILQELHSVVSYFFGKEIADTNCFQLLKLPPDISPVCIDDYIERTIRIISKESDFDSLFWKTDNKTTLTDIILKDEFNGLKFCLLADAHQGKSFLIRQTAYQLNNSPRKIIPLVVDIKDSAVQPIENILSSLYAEWKQIPFYDLVIFIDGLDEVTSNNFEEMTKYINQFSIKYYSIKIIFSCRQVFFDRYNVASIVPSFTIYELMPLHHQSISNFINQKLKNKAEKFENKIEILGLSSLLYHPFFLINLIKKFEKNINQIPKSKQEAFDNVIEDSYKEIYNKRRLREGIPLRNQSNLFKSVVQRFAVTLQLLGTNSLSDNDGQKVFNLDELQLLEHNSLITYKFNQWSFVNAFFQENLAALALSQMSFEEICKHISVGNRIKKIKIKWLQTVSSLLSLLQTSSPLFSQLMEFIKQDNIELLFDAEKAKFSPLKRFEILKELIEKISNSETGLMHTQVEKIAFFINEDINAEKYLLDKLCDTNISDRIKYIIAKIIGLLTLSDTIKSEIVIKILAEVDKTSSIYNARTLVEIITNNNLGTIEIIDKLLLNQHTNKHDFRNCIYDLIIQSNCVDKYYQFGLEGINILIQYDHERNQIGGEYSVEMFLLATNLNSNLLKLLLLAKEEQWERYYQKHNESKKSFFRNLVEKLVILQQQKVLDTKIPILLIELIKSEEQRANNEVTLVLCDFFVKTGLQAFALRLVWKDIIIRNFWDLGLLITEDSFDYIIFEIEQFKSLEEYKNGLKRCISVLRYKGKNELADQFYELSMSASEGYILDDSPDYQKKYLELEEKKKKNDLKYIQSTEAFVDGLKKYFNSYGKKKVTENDIYVDYESSTARKQIDSNFLFKFLNFWMPKNSITLENCIKKVNQNSFFDLFRATVISQSNVDLVKGNEVLLHLLEEYYHREIKNANFINCYSEVDNRLTWLTKEKLLSEIFEKFEFVTPKEKLMEMVWMDTSGINQFRDSFIPNEKKSISKLIIEKLNEDELEDFKLQIYKNISSGIKCESVLTTHIGLCTHLNIYEATEPIFDLLCTKCTKHINFFEIVNSFLYLGGESEKLIPIFESFENYNDYTYENFVEKLYEPYSEIVTKSLLKCLLSETASDDIKVKAAKYLIKLGVKDGFLFILELIRIHNISPYFTQGNINLDKIDTKFALSEMGDLMYLLIDNHTDTIIHLDSAKYNIIDFVNRLAAKSEEDLHLVCDFLYEQKEKLATQYATSNDFAWYAERVVENFRNLDKTQLNINDVKKVLSELNI